MIKMLATAVATLALSLSMLGAVPDAEARPNPHIPFAECSNAGRSVNAHDVIPCVWDGQRNFVIRKSGVNDISQRRADVLLGVRAPSHRESGWGCGGAC